MNIQVLWTVLDFVGLCNSGNDFRWSTCCAVKRMERTAPICIDEFERVQRLTRQTAKVTMPLRTQLVGATPNLYL